MVVYDCLLNAAGFACSLVVFVVGWRVCSFVVLGCLDVFCLICFAGCLSVCCKMVMKAMLRVEVWLLERVLLW